MGLRYKYVRSYCHFDGPKGRVQKLKSAKVWSLTIEGGRESPETKSLVRPVFIVLILTFSVQILKILSKKNIVNVKCKKKIRGGRGSAEYGQRPYFRAFQFWDPSLTYT